MSFTNIAQILSVIFIIATLSSQIDCKALRATITRQVVDSPHDLLALPTQDYHEVVTYEQSPQYVVHETHATQEESYPQPKPETQVRQEIQYVTPDGQPLELVQSHHHKRDCNHEQSNPEHNMESSTPSEPQPSEGYPGEILYSDQNGNLFRQVGDQYEPASATTSLMPIGEQQKSTDLSTLTGTILTEVPLRDLPDQVLDQLKKDYGAEIVATREYPGADLVINCGDGSSQDISICHKPKQSNSDYLSYSLISSTLNDNKESKHEHENENHEHGNVHDLAEHEILHETRPASPEHEPTHMQEERPEEQVNAYTQEPLQETYETTEKVGVMQDEGYVYRGNPHPSQDEQPEASAPAPVDQEKIQSIEPAKDLDSSEKTDEVSNE